MGSREITVVVLLWVRTVEQDDGKGADLHPKDGESRGRDGGPCKEKTGRAGGRDG